MNKKLYRLIFSKTKGMLVAVAEFTRSHRAEASTSSGVKPRLQQISQLSAVSFGILLALGNVQTAQANIVADAGAALGQQPTISVNPNGTTQVDIQAPSAAGVSRNVYSEFNVGQQGVILNNSQNGAMTQLAGEIAGNAALAQGAAKIILNEVNSANPSQLNGMIEVAGQKAQVIIANPSGITCDGCGFINANRATLTTGQAQMENGVLTGYRVNGGEIIVQGAGMDSSSQDYTDIISRSVKINSSLHAGDLRITTGRNQVDAGNQQITKLDDDASVAPALALDVSSLGGMYAGKITLVGTEKGVGVNNAGTIHANADAIVLGADGNITNRGTLTGTNISLAGAEINNLYSAGIEADRLEITANNDVNFTGNHAILLDELSVDAGGDINNDSYLYANRNFSLKAKNVNNSGTLSSDALYSIEAKETVNNSGLMSSNFNFDVKAGKSIENTGVLESYLLMKLDADSITNRDTIESAYMLEINTGALNNRGGSIISQGKANVFAEKLNNEKGTISAARNMNLKVSVLHNEEGDIQSGDTHLYGSTTEVERTDNTIYGSYHWKSNNKVDKLIQQMASITGVRKDILQNIVEYVYEDFQKGDVDVWQYYNYLKNNMPYQIKDTEYTSESINLFLNTLDALLHEKTSLPTVTPETPVAPAEPEVVEKEVTVPTVPVTPVMPATPVAPDEAEKEATVPTVPVTPATPIAPAAPDEAEEEATVPTVPVTPVMPATPVTPAESDEAEEEAAGGEEAAEVPEATENEETSSVTKDLSDISIFDAWKSSGSVHQQINAAVNTKEIPATILRDMLNYMYLVLADNGEITDDMVQSWAQATWGMASSEKNIAAVKTIANIMTAQWEAAVPEVIIPEETETVKPDDSVLPEFASTDVTAFDEWNDKTNATEKVLAAINKNELEGRGLKGQTFFLNSVMNYMYYALANGYELTPQLVESIAKNAWGLGATDSSVSTAMQIADVMKESWSAEHNE